MTTPHRIEQLRQEYRNMLEYLGADVEAEMEAFDSKLHALLLAVRDEQKELCANSFIDKIERSRVEPGDEFKRMYKKVITEAPNAYEKEVV